MRQILGTIFLGIAALGALVVLLSAVGIIFDIEMTFGTHGAQSDLPTHWDEVIALAIVLALFGALGGVLSSERIARAYRENALLKWGTILLIPALLAVGGWQMRYLN